MDKKANIKDLSLEELEEYMKEHNFPAYRGRQVFEWVYKDVSNFEYMENVPKYIIKELQNDFELGRAEIIKRQVSKFDGTRKYLLRFKDGNSVECVLMEYSYGKTICISTQIGCKMGCSFCASTIGGLTRNLTCGEMIEEIMAVSRDIGERISNIVLMGIGEPFDNYEEVMKFLKLVNTEKGLNIGLRHITISTSGIIPKIYEFADSGMQCTLAISLHGADDEVRNSIMPINRKYSISELLEACRYYIKKTNKRITFEYALIKNVNDDIKSAQKLAKLLKGMLCHVNLIPVNYVEGNEYKKSSKENIYKFKDVLESSGIETTIRRELGSDIDAACGQLRRRYIEET